MKIIQPYQSYKIYQGDAEIKITLFSTTQANQPATWLALVLHSDMKRYRGYIPNVQHRVIKF
jgi:hypothetical protein